MPENERETLIRQYATGEVTWSSLRKRGFDDYLDVLAALGELGLRPPVTPIEGVNAEARRRGIEFVRQRLREQAKP